MENRETPDEWQRRRAEVKRRTGTMHGPPLRVVVQSVADGRPLIPGEYTQDQLLPTPTASEATGPGGQREGTGLNLRSAMDRLLLPTPTAQDGANNAGPSQHERNSLPLNAAVTYLPQICQECGNDEAAEGYPYCTDCLEAGADLLAVPDDLDPPGEQMAIPMPGEKPIQNWGPYGEAIARWEHRLGRSAPPPLVDGKLGAEFTEWVMGLPAGWVTGVAGVPRNGQLKMLGNGVVPAQATAALIHLGIREIVRGW